MSKQLMIKQELYGIEQGEFQEVCNRYLLKNYGGELHSPGTMGDKNKTKPGKPDTYLVQADNTYVIAEVTTHDRLDKTNFANKLKGDLNSCLEFANLGITAKQVRCIVLCCNSSVDLPLREELNQIVAPYNIPLTLIPLLTLVDFFYSVDKVYARDLWNVPFETGQVLTKEDFINHYGNNHVSTPLNNELFGRAHELAYLKNTLNTNNIALVSGPAGVGKSRLAIQAMDNFIAENESYKAYFILSKPESIIEDLLTFLVPKQSYIILIDDANRQLENVLSVLYRTIESDIKVKIILTVRDYAKADVEKILGETKFQNVFIGRLNDDTINQILLAFPFIVEDYGLRNRIIEISQGNARLAIMAADVIKHNQNSDLLKDVTSIYDAYFQSIINDQSLFKDTLTIQVLGLLSFFQTIDRDEQQELDIITDFGISMDDFNQRVQMLESLELVDVNFTSIVKIGDQVMGTYFFYLAFFRLKVLSTGQLLLNYFQRYQWRIRDTFLPAINTFGTESVIGTNPDYLLNYLQRVQGNSTDTFAFFDVFGPFLPQKLFLFISQLTTIAEPSAEDFPEINTKRGNQPDNHDHVLRLLEPFYKENLNNFQIALGLAIQYIHKQRPLLNVLISHLKAPLYATGDDVRDNYEKQIAAYNFLKNHLNDSPAYKLIFYYVFQHVFLNTGFNYELYETRNGKTVFKERFDQLRQNFWKDILEQYDNDKEICFDILIEYLDSRGRETFIYLNADQIQITAIIKSRLKPTNFGDCYFVQEYINLLTDQKIEIIPELKSIQRRFHSKNYKIFSVLALERNEKRKRFSEYHDYHKQAEVQLHFLNEKLPVTKTEEFIAIYNSVDEYINFKYWHKANITFGFTVVIENSFTHNVELGYRILDYYLQHENILNLIPGRLFNTLFQLDTIDHQRLYNLIKQTDFKYQQDWLERYWECLPETFITESLILQLLDDFKNASNYYTLRLQNFDRYEKVAPGTIKDICEVLMAKYAANNEYVFKVEYFFFEHYSLIRDQYLEVAKRLFLLQEKINNEFDPRGGELFYLIEKDVNFFNEYIDYRLEIYKEHYSSPRALLNKIWEFPEAEKLVYDTLVKLLLVDGYSFGINDFAFVFFVQLSDEFQLAAVRTLEKLIVDYGKNGKMLSLIWNITRNRLPAHYGHLIRYWLQIHGDIEVFKKCDWTNNSFSHTGERQIWADFRAKDFQFVYNAIAELPDQYKYVEYHAWITDRIAMEMRSGDWERKRLYRGYR
jgi:hypothetical protein